MGNEIIVPPGRIGLGQPPAVESKPLRLSTRRMRGLNP
jgi:hypothetical protein